MNPKWTLVPLAAILLVSGCGNGSQNTQAVPSESPAPLVTAVDLPTSTPSPAPTCQAVTDDADAAYFIRVATRAVKISVNVTFEKSVTPLCSPVTIGATWYSVSMGSSGAYYDLSLLDANKGVYDGSGDVIFMGHSDVCYGLLVLAYVGAEPVEAELPRLRQPQYGDKKYLEVVGLAGRIVAGEYYPPSSRC